MGEPALPDRSSRVRRTMFIDPRAPSIPLPLFKVAPHRGDARRTGTRLRTLGTAPRIKVNGTHSHTCTARFPIDAQVRRNCLPEWNRIEQGYSWPSHNSNAKVSRGWPGWGGRGGTCIKHVPRNWSSRGTTKQQYEWRSMNSVFHLTFHLRDCAAVSVDHDESRALVPMNLFDRAGLPHRCRRHSRRPTALQVGTTRSGG